MDARPNHEQLANPDRQESLRSLAAGRGGRFDRARGSFEI